MPSGRGGNTQWGAGGNRLVQVMSGQVGQPGMGYGSGGSGGVTINAGGAFAGGAGAPGFVIITEYLST